MSTPSFIDTLNHIQTRVRDGAKWEYQVDVYWYSGTTESHLNRVVEHGRPVRLVPKPRYWSKPEDVPGPVCWVREAHANWAYIITGITQNGVETTQDGFAFRHEWEVMPLREYSTDRINWNPCVIES